MNSKRSQLVRALGILTVGVGLILNLSVSVQASDAIDDPVRQPHLKSWSNIIPDPNRRFIGLADFNQEAILDRETGLVWERDPSAIDSGIDSWSVAAFKCIRKAVGGRKGWRLPAVHELASLVDVSVSADAVRLPPGHPFQNIGLDFYWTATTYAVDVNRAWVVRFLGGGVVTEDKPVAHPFWCVRGGIAGLDAY
ncbi:MAG: DUF1566 domain-containing protein [Nitrospirota bacterium]|nr:DUF1566 domain-containing protein [Nitrospirota bacterium]